MGDVSIMLLSGILPAILLVLYVRYRDKQQPEPWSKIIKGVFYGILSVVVTMLITQIWDHLPFIIGLGWLYEVPIVRSIFTSFYNAAIPEEKFLTGTSRKSLSSENSTISSKCAFINFRSKPIIAPFI